MKILRYNYAQSSQCFIERILFFLLYSKGWAFAVVERVGGKAAWRAEERIKMKRLKGMNILTKSIYTPSAENTVEGGGS